MPSKDKFLLWLSGEIQTPPFSEEARIEAGVFLRQLQQGKSLGLPHSRPLPVIGTRCHELRIRDEDVTWRIIYRLEPDAVLILDVFDKKTETTPAGVIKNCQRRLKQYLDAI